MQQPEYFDYKKLAKQLHVPPDRLEMLEKEVRDEFPHDPMLFELHMVRALKSEFRQHKSRAKHRIAQ